jgi:hypothetical protein
LEEMGSGNRVKKEELLKEEEESDLASDVKW